MARILGILLVLLASVGAWAQGPADSWDSLRGLVAGQQVRVVLNDAKSYTGPFQAVRDEAIVVRLAMGDQTFTRESILRVSTPGRGHRGRNAAIGALVGGVVGLLTMRSALCNLPDPECEPRAEAVGLVVGLGAGAGAGAALPTAGWRDVYRAPQRRSGSTR
jgi:hypothetical protein